MIFPGLSQALHIGVDDGLHGHNTKEMRIEQNRFGSFQSDTFCERSIPPLTSKQGNGGWGHPADMKHCMQLLQKEKESSNVEELVDQKLKQIDEFRKKPKQVKATRANHASSQAHVPLAVNCRETKKMTFDESTLRQTVIPFAIMADEQVEDLRKAVESLRASDFPHSDVPLIISFDGHIPELEGYVDSLEEEGHFRVEKLYHPYSCYDHPDSFPGDDKSLDMSFKDSYGNTRESSATCKKHHFTWLLKTLYEMDFEQIMVFEEAYLVAPNVYSTVTHGAQAIHQLRGSTDEEFFGLALEDRTHKQDLPSNTFVTQPFTSGPIMLSRAIIGQLRENAALYCEFDEVSSFVCTYCL